MKKIIELNETDGKHDLAQKLWDWLKEKGYVKTGDIDYVDKKIQLIIEIIEI